MKNLPENRQEVIDDYFSHWDCYYNVDDFINQKVDSLCFNRDGVDWDETTNAIVSVYTYEEKLKEIEKTYKELLRKLNKGFDKL